MIHIRHADASDVPWLLTELRAFNEFAGMDLWPSDDAKADAIVRTLIEGPPFVFFVAVNGDTRLGFIAGQLRPHFYNDRKLVLTEMLWWVMPAARRTRVGHLLLDAFNAFALEHADEAVMTLETRSPVNPETLERRGYVLAERAYRMVVAR